MRHFHQAFRSLLRAPAFTLVGILTLGLAVGANTAIFSVARAVLLEPLPFHQPERLARIYNHPPGKAEVTFEASYPNYLDWRRERGAFEGLAGFASSGDMVVDFGGGAPEHVTGKYVSWNLFSVLGAEPLVGRALAPEDDLPGAEPVAVIGEGLWRRRFGGDPGALGRRFRADGESRTLVGVMPAAFEYPTGAELWVPVASALPAAFLENPQLKFFNLLGRLREGVSREEAAAELNAVIEGVTNPQLPEGARSAATLAPLAEELLGDTRAPLLFLLAAAALVLLVAILNVAGLAIVRAVGRQRELAVRGALGAGWRDLARPFLAEGALLAAAGAALGVALARWAVPELLALAPRTFFRAGHIVVDARVLTFALVLGLALAAVLGTVPALYGARRQTGGVSRALEEGAGRATTGGVAGRRLLGGLVVAQMALAVVVLLGAGVLLKSFALLAGADAGFERRGVLTFGVPLLDAKYQDPAAADRFYDELLARLGALPGVRSAAAVLLRPLETSNGIDVSFTVEGRPEAEQATHPLLNYLAVTPGYFRALGQPLLAGRAFTDADREDAPGVVILSRAVVELLWPGADPATALGARLKWGGPESPSPWLEVVGVVGDSRHQRMEAVSLNAYAPYRQDAWGLNHAVVRAAPGADPMALAAAARAAVRELDPALAPMDLATTGQLVSRAVARPRFQTLLVGIFAFLALVLGAVGLYGVMAYIVTLRAPEMGVRLALGAEPAAVLRLTLGGALRLAAAGAALGLAAGLLLARIAGHLLGGTLYRVGAADPLTFTAVPAVLLATALLAALLPALRASRTDPATALRAE